MLDLKKKSVVLIVILIVLIMIIINNNNNNNNSNNKVANHNPHFKPSEQEILKEELKATQNLRDQLREQVIEQEAELRNFKEALDSERKSHNEDGVSWLWTLTSESSLFSSWLSLLIYYEWLDNMFISQDKVVRAWILYSKY